MERKPREGKEFPKPPPMIHFRTVTITGEEGQLRISHEPSSR
jgi:hypothetical protein